MTYTPATLAVIVPVYNEEDSLPTLTEQLTALQADGADVVCIDGGSTDRTVTELRIAGFSVLTSPAGRARQMRYGVEATASDQLLFLHADTTLPPRAASLINDALTRNKRANPKKPVWGRFDVTIAGRWPGLPVVARMMNLRSRLTGHATGDQAMFCTRASYTTAGGFPDQPLMEDIELSRRLLRISKPAYVRPPATTSGRRWDTHGGLKTVAQMWWIRFAYWAGASPDRVASWYHEPHNSAPQPHQAHTQPAQPSQTQPQPPSRNQPAPSH